MAKSAHRPSTGRKASTSGLASRARAIRLAVFDVDGVMTDGHIYLGESGEEMKAFHVLDGHGLKMLREDGIELAIISGRRARCVERRAAELGIPHVIQGAGDKLPVYLGLLDQLKLAPEQTSYMGDDVVDLPVLERCAFAFTVPAAPDAVKRVAHHVTRRAGGNGAVREACELLMRLRVRPASRKRGEA